MYRPRNIENWPKIGSFSHIFIKNGVFYLFFKQKNKSMKPRNAQTLCTWIKKFLGGKIYLFLLEKKNRPEISISGHFLAIWKIFIFYILCQNFGNFDFEHTCNARISCVSSKNFLIEKNMHFLAGTKNSARNFYPRPYSGHLKKNIFHILRQILENFGFRNSCNARISCVS